MAWVQKFTAGSTSNPNIEYQVGIDDKGVWGCSCPAWKFQRGKRGECKHIQMIKRLNGAPASASAPTTVRVREATPASPAKISPAAQKPPILAQMPKPPVRDTPAPAPSVLAKPKRMVLLDEVSE